MHLFNTSKFSATQSSRREPLWTFSILDAKDRIERLCARLEYAVKIGGKKGHDIFGTGDEEKQSKVSKFFFQAREVATPTVKSHGIFGAEYGSKSDA